MQSKQFRIGQLANILSVETFVIRFWEKEFNIKSKRTGGQQRFYSEKDLEKFAQIKDLLYQQGMTIAGAKKKLETQYTRTQLMSATKISPQDPQFTVGKQHREQLIDLKHQLLKIRELLQ
jgi:DNA-binding transcriptional MerR regulator